MSRREKIEAMLVDEPHDVFLRYSLALELAKESRHDESLRLLRELSREAPPYVPAFFMAGQQLASLGRRRDAQAELRQGIDAARAAGNAHAAAEMGELLASLGGAGEAPEE